LVSAATQSFRTGNGANCSLVYRCRPGIGDRLDGRGVTSSPRVGVDEGANLNAPSSLSHAPAVGSEQPDREDELRRREWGRILRTGRFSIGAPTLQLSATPHRTHANIGVNVNR